MQYTGGSITKRVNLQFFCKSPAQHIKQILLKHLTLVQLPSVVWPSFVWPWLVWDVLNHGRSLTAISKRLASGTYYTVFLCFALIFVSYWHDVNAMHREFQTCEDAHFYKIIFTTCKKRYYCNVWQKASCQALFDKALSDNVMRAIWKVLPTDAAFWNISHVFLCWLYKRKT